MPTLLRRQHDRSDYCFACHRCYCFLASSCNAYVLAFQSFACSHTSDYVKEFRSFNNDVIVHISLTHSLNSWQPLPYQRIATDNRVASLVHVCVCYLLLFTVDVCELSTHQRIRKDFLFPFAETFPYKRESKCARFFSIDITNTCSHIYSDSYQPYGETTYDDVC